MVADRIARVVEGGGAISDQQTRGAVDARNTDGEKCWRVEELVGKLAASAVGCGKECFDDGCAQSIDRATGLDARRLGHLVGREASAIDRALRLGVERLRGGGGLEVEARAVHEVGGLLGGVGQRAQVCILQRELGLEHRESIEGVCQRGGEALGEFAEFAAVEPRMQRCELLAAGGAVGVRHGGARLDVVVLRTSKGGVDGGVRKIFRLRAEQGAQPIGALVGGKGAQLCQFDVQRTCLAGHGGAEIGVSISGDGFAIGDQRLGGVGVDRTRGHQPLGHAQVELRARN